MDRLPSPAPKAKSGRFFDAPLYGPSWTFWSKSALLDIFLGIRFYFVSAVALASGQLQIAALPVDTSYTNALTAAAARYREGYVAAAAHAVELYNKRRGRLADRHGGDRFTAAEI